MSAQPQAGFRPRHLVFYDGVCGLCNRLVRVLLREDRREVLGFVSLQSQMGRRLLEEHGLTATLDTLYVLAGSDSPEPRLLSRSAAVVFLLDATGWTRTSRLLAVLSTAMLDCCYDRVAKHRYRMFGRHSACPLPAAEHRRRFLDL